MNFILFYTRTCHNCPSVKNYLNEKEIDGIFVDASVPEGLEKARLMNIESVPTVIFFEDSLEVIRVNTIEACKAVLKDEY